METRANYAVIGVFTLAVIAAAFGFIFWFSGSEGSQRRTPIRIVFNGPVAGLSRGAAVVFNGIRVGDVTKVYFERDKPQQAFATIEIDRDTPVKADTKANLDTQILSGAAVISLRGGVPESPPLAAREGEDMPTIVADQSGIASVLETARTTAQKANDLLDVATGLIADNRDTINRSLHNVETFTDALGRNAPGIDRALASIAQAAETVGPAAQRIAKLADDADSVIRAVDGRKIASILDSVDGVLKAVNDNRQALGDAIQDTSTLMRRLNDIAPKLDGAVGGLNQVMAQIDPAKIGAIVDNTNRFATALSNASRDVEGTARNANSLTAKLDQAAGRIDGVLKAAENFLGSAAGEEGKSTFASIREAMDKFGRASDNLNKQATIIGSGVGRFTASGSKQLEGVAVDARRTVNDVGRAARNLDRDPSSVIFGSKPSLPEYNGR